MYVLNTTAKQDQAMLQFIERNPDGNVDPSALGAGLMVRENCTTAVCNTLQHGGVLREGEDANGAMSFLSDPDELQSSLESGDLEDDVGTVIVFDPEADEKAQQNLSTLVGASCFYTGLCGVQR